jgi:hypothetical protein
VGTVLVLVAVGLGIMAAYIAAGLSGATGATQSSPSTVTRHENSHELDGNYSAYPFDNAPAVDKAPAGFSLGPRRGGNLTE